MRRIQIRALQTIAAVCTSNDFARKQAVDAKLLLWIASAMNYHSSNSQLASEVCA